jgi:hypothetical protein
MLYKTGNKRGFASGCSQLVQNGQIFIYELRTQQQISRWIACGGKLRRKHQIRPGIHASPVGSQQLVTVAGEIADGSVDLSQRYFHGSFLIGLGKTSA